MKEPASLVIPTNENGTFSCKALCDHLCLRLWLINDSVFEPEAGDQRMHLERHGDVTIGFTLTLTVNASQLMNNTRMGCRFEATGVRYEIVSTRSAVLFVVSGIYVIYRRLAIGYISNIRYTGIYHTFTWLYSMLYYYIVTLHGYMPLHVCLEI